MDTPPIALDRFQAKTLYREYLAHRHFGKPVDDEIRRTYREIAKGGVVIRALDAVRAAGLNAQNLPKLAIIRADAEECWLSGNRDGSVRFSDRHWHRLPTCATRHFIEFPPGTFPGIAQPSYYARAIRPADPVEIPTQNRDRQLSHSF